MKNLPNTWRMLQLGQIVKSIDGGISIRASDRAAIRGEHGVLTLSAVSYGFFDSRANKAFSNRDTTNLGRSVRARTVLISRSNTIELVGACVFVERDFPHLHLPDLIWEMSLEAGRFDPQWFYYALSSSYCRAQIQSRATGTSGSMKKLSMASLRTVEVPIPPFTEQQAIARVLKIWDRGIRQLSDLIAAKLRFKQGLMQQLLTGRRRFPEFKDEWEHVHIGDIATERSERNKGENSIPVLSCTKYDGLVDSLTYFGKRVFSENTANYKVVRKSDFAYATNHIEEGSIGLLSHADAGLVSPMYTVFRTKKELVAPEFLFRLLKTETYRQIFASFTSASVNRRGSLRWKQFATIPLRLPSLAEQHRIDEILAVFDREINILRRQLDALKNAEKGPDAEAADGTGEGEGCSRTQCARAKTMKKKHIVELHTSFEQRMKTETESGMEFWLARDLQELLGYAQWRNFEQVIEKAKISCINSGYDVEDHFADVSKMVEVGSGAQRKIDDVMLSRYACYLIAQNGDPNKDQIAFAQTYFAVQTRKMEVIEQRLAEMERLGARKKLTQSEKQLSGIIFERLGDGQSFARIRSKGDQALFGGQTTQDMKDRLGVPKSRALADFLPHNHHQGQGLCQ